MKRPTELERFVAALCAESPETEIAFREESARDIRYALVVSTEDCVLLRKLARLFGCSDKHRFSIHDTKFEAFDSWHGKGELNLRNLADELTATYGEFFDFSATIAELRLLADGVCDTCLVQA